MDHDAITEYIFVEDTDPSGDVAFVFGTWNAWKESVERASYLYSKGLVQKVMVCGGKHPTAGIIEGEFLAKELEKRGVSLQDILIENTSTNTKENVVFSNKIIEQKVGWENVRTITAVVKNYHARRVLMTLRKYVPPHVKLKACVYESAHYPFNRRNWHMLEVGKIKVTEELSKIKKYLAQGDLAEL